MTANGGLRYDLFVSGLLPASAPPAPNGEHPHWSPLSHTLIHGPAEAVVVDPPITVTQATALADWIESSGKRLTYIYITHWHADHWLTTGELARRFPGVTVYASEATIGRMVRATPDGVPDALWSGLPALNSSPRCSSCTPAGSIPTRYGCPPAACWKNGKSGLDGAGYFGHPQTGQCQMWHSSHEDSPCVGCMAPPPPGEHHLTW
jgi:hypothetical protein